MVESLILMTVSNTLTLMVCCENVEIVCPSNNSVNKISPLATWCFKIDCKSVFLDGSNKHGINSEGTELNASSIGANIVSSPLKGSDKAPSKNINNIDFK